jgi:hypothetical protein
MNTWDKKVLVNNKKVPKKNVLRYYKKLWREKPSFRKNLKKRGAFVRATYGNKKIIKRKGVNVNNIKDLEKLIKEHSVEFIAPTKNIDKSVIDIDFPPRLLPKKRYLSRKVVNDLKRKNIPISIVTDSPRGAHIFSSAPKSQIRNALNEIAKNDSDNRFHVGKSSKTKIVLDPYEPNVAVPDSLSCNGKPYKRWNKI